MVNSEAFSKRLQIILNYYDISAATFADAIHVGRSSISHILSGRNKPSLDFVLKIVQTYPDVELYWLLNGKGDFPKSPTTKTVSVEKKEISAPSTSIASSNKELLKEDSNLEVLAEKEENSAKKIKRVVLFYEDGTFEAYDN